jgi:hypothetical protein
MLCSVLVVDVVVQMIALCQSNIVDIYEKAKSSGRMHNPAAFPVDFHKERIRTGRWQYQALANAKPMQKFLDALVTQARAGLEKMQLESPVPIKVRCLPFPLASAALDCSRQKVIWRKHALSLSLSVRNL